MDLVLRYSERGEPGTYRIAEGWIHATVRVTDVSAPLAVDVQYTFDPRNGATSGRRRGQVLTRVDGETWRLTAFDVAPGLRLSLLLRGWPE